jgi:EAL domain-containing protein (putative c-di-GMP-specific phosphodiesterase class I)
MDSGVSEDGDTRANAQGPVQGQARRLVVIVAMLGIAAALAAVGGAYQVARTIDASYAQSRASAMRDAVSEFRALFGTSREVDPRFLRMIAQSAGVTDVQFAPEPPPPGRDMQPVLNAQGRILGFVSWQADRPMLQAMNRLAPWIGVVMFGLVGLVGFLWRARQSRTLPGLSVPEANAPPIAQTAVPVIMPETEDPEHQFIRRELPRALKARVLDVHYQPIVSAAGGTILGVEALLRWTHPDRGAIPPAVFVAVAEQMGLMEELGGFVLRRALEDARTWPNLYLSVNLSPLQVRDRRIVDVVREALRQSAIPPKRLTLEITEGVLIDNPEEMLRRIEELRALGVRIALDDFGSGYSSLGYLQRFAFDKLKIDRSFVAALGHSPNAAVIVQAIVALGRALGVKVVVEGVETEEQRVLLRLAGCDEMQGFLFARPAPAKAIDVLIASAKPAKSAA